MKSLLWVEDSLIKEMQLLSEVEEISQDKIKALTQKFNNEVEMLSDNVDANVLELRAKAQRVKDTYTKAVEEECEAIDLLWEKLDSVRYDAKKKLEVTLNEIVSIEQKLKSVNQLIDKTFVADYRIEKTLDVIRKVTNMSDTEREMFKKLLED